MCFTDLLFVVILEGVAWGICVFNRNTGNSLHGGLEVVQIVDRL